MYKTLFYISGKPYRAMHSNKLRGKKYSPKFDVIVPLLGQ
jgi:hypothetical protein